MLYLPVPGSPPSFFTCVNVPLANHRSFACCTLDAADKLGVTISIPWTGVNDSDVDVPDFASAEVVERPSICVLILFARDNFAAISDTS